MFTATPPSQRLPPELVTGASQLLFREEMPPPHVAEQLVQDCQFLHTEVLQMCNMLYKC